MSLDDVRLQWLRDRALAVLGLTYPAPFEELLNRGDGQAARTVLRFFDRGTEDGDNESAVGTALLLLRAEWRGEEAVGEAPCCPGPLSLPWALPDPEPPRFGLPSPAACFPLPWAPVYPIC